MEKLKVIKNKMVDVLKSKKFQVFFHYIFFPILIVLLADIYFKLNSLNDKTLFYNLKNTLLENVKPFILTCFLIMAVNSLLISITNSARKSMIIISLFFMILLPVNDFKYHIMGEPVKVSDVNFLNSSNTGMMVSVMDTLKGSWMKTTFIKSGVSILLFILFIWFEGKINFKFENKKARVIILVLSLLVCFLLIFPPKFLRLFLLNDIFDDNKKEDFSRNTSNTTVYLDYGWIQGLYYSFLSDYIMPPDDYNKNHVDDVISVVSNDVEENWGRPNVVFILSESFWDISKLDEFEFNVDLTSNIKRLEETNRCISFDMLSPSYGGASVNVEFEILTGGSISYFNTGYIPYLQLYKNNDASKRIPNLIKEFNNAGYETKYISSWGRSSYNSQNVFKIMGASQTIYDDDLVDPVRKGNIADSYMMDVILDELTNKEDKNKFLFVTTAQNHMPYSKYRYPIYDVDIVNSTMNEEFNDIARCYAQGVYDADKELGRLYDEIQTLDEPTVVVFFGDHLPYLLNISGENIVDVASYFNTENESLNELRKYTTQCVIVSNFDMNVDEQIDMMNASYVGAYLLDHLDMEVSSYFSYLNTVRNGLPVYNRNFVYKNAEFTAVSDLNDEDKLVYQEKQQVQYRYFIDND